MDHETVLISSQNWSSPAVSENREAGVVIAYPDLAEYFAGIFEFDWSTGIQSFDELPARQLFSRQGEEDLGADGESVVPMLPSEFAEV